MTDPPSPDHDGRRLHEHLVPAREARHGRWPGWVPAPVLAALEGAGRALPWEHQVAVAEHARAGRDVVVATGTASGKSLGYLVPALAAALEGGTTLYLAPTKALAADQLAAVAALGVPGVRAGTYDGDSTPQARRFAREHAHLVLTNPDMLHRALLPGHARHARLLRGLRHVVVDECHHYGGLLGAHVAAVLRRLLRVAAHHGASPSVVLASATTADPAGSAAALTGRAAVSVTDDASPRGATRFWTWEPPVLGDGRRSAVAESAELMADLVGRGVATLVFTRSRRGAETVATLARERLAARDEDAARDASREGGGARPAGLATRVAAYRSGYLPEERRALEAALRGGDLLGLASTSALELGVDVSRLGAVVMAGWPGSRAALWQRAGRAGRSGEDALAVLVADQDPLDTYLVHHPEAIFGAPVEATVVDLRNPRVLAGHLGAAAAELPLRPGDLAAFGPGADAAVQDLVGAGLLRARPSGWFWVGAGRAVDRCDLRGGGGEVQLVESATGRVLGTVGTASAHAVVHPGAVYVHQGAVHRVEELDEEAGVALLRREDVDERTSARTRSRVAVVGCDARRAWGAATVARGDVEVESRVVSFVRRRASTGAVVAEVGLDLPARTLATRAVWWTLPAGPTRAAGVVGARLEAAVHAVEHAAVALLPLVASCDRRDVGSVSVVDPATGAATVFVHDVAEGGAGLADRAFAAAGTWLGAAADLLARCPCAAGCPACVQSPTCGRGNRELDKAGALVLLRLLLAGAPGADADAGVPAEVASPA